MCLRGWLFASFESLIEFTASCVLFKRVKSSMFFKETAITNADLQWPMGLLLLHSWDDRFEVFLVLKHTDSVCSTVAQLPIRC